MTKPILSATAGLALTLFGACAAQSGACPPCQCQCGPGPSSVVAAPTNPAAYDGLSPAEQELLSRYEGVAAADVLVGKATYYSNTLSGRKTASGEVYDPKLFTAAHKTLPFGTVVRVVRTDTNRYVYARVNDRGPFSKADRIIDISYIAAERLEMLRAGVVPVRVEVMP